MNKWERQTRLEDCFLDMHKIKPQIEHMRESREKYHIKLKHGGKEVILTEKLRNGLTDYATLEYAGNIEQFKSYYDAEVRATEILKEK